MTKSATIIRGRLLAGVGYTHPITMRAVNRGYHEPDNPASCYYCGLMGPCPHDLVTEQPDKDLPGRRFKHTKAMGQAGELPADAPEMMIGAPINTVLHGDTADRVNSAMSLGYAKRS